MQIDRSNCCRTIVYLRSTSLPSIISELIEFLEQHWQVKQGGARARSGRLTDDAADEALQKLEELRRAYLAELSRMSQEDLWHAAIDAMKEQDNLRPFNQFGSEADFDHFGRFAFLTVDEAVALSLGKNPRMVTWSTVKCYLGRSAFAYDYRDRLELVERAVIWGELPERFTPLQFLTWAHKYRVAVPEAFIECTIVRGEPIQYWHEVCEVLAEELDTAKAELQDCQVALAAEQEARVAETQRTFDDWLRAQEQFDQLRAEHDAQLRSHEEGFKRAAEEVAALREQLAKPAEASEKCFGTAERNSLLALVATAAVDAYCFDPARQRSTAAKDWADAAAGLGFQITDETVLKYMRLGTQLPSFDASGIPRRKPKSAKLKPNSA